MRKNKVSRQERLAFEYEAKMVEALVLLMATGGDCMDDIRMLREDKALCRLLGMNFPSPETVRKFLYEFHDESLIELAAEIAERNKQVVIPRQSR